MLGRDYAPGVTRLLRLRTAVYLRRASCRKVGFRKPVGLGNLQQLTRGMELADRLVECRGRVRSPLRSQITESDGISSVGKKNGIVLPLFGRSAAAADVAPRGRRRRNCRPGARASIPAGSACPSPRRRIVDQGLRVVRALRDADRLALQVRPVLEPAVLAAEAAPPARSYGVGTRSRSSRDPRCTACWRSGCRPCPAAGTARGWAA